MTSLHCSNSKYGDLTVVTASGDVDFATSEALWDALRAPLVPLSALGLECTGITFFDSMGLQVLMRTRQLAFEQRASFSLIGENRYLEQVLKLTGLTDVIPHFVDIKAAQAGLDRSVQDGYRDPTARAETDGVDR